MRQQSRGRLLRLQCWLFWRRIYVRMYVSISLPPFTILLYFLLSFPFLTFLYSDAASCASKPCGPNALCEQQGTSFVCGCKPGYTGEPPFCRGILILVSPHPPPPASFLIPFLAPLLIHLFSDVNECAGSNTCGGGTCFNTEGNYSCSCPPGYHDQGGICQGNPIIVPFYIPANNNRIKIIIEVKYYIKILISFLLHSWLSIDFYVYSDNDECATNMCGSHSTCVNTPGSYTCTCAYGYAWNGTHCKGNIFIYFVSTPPP